MNKGRFALRSGCSLIFPGMEPAVSGVRSFSCPRLKLGRGQDNTPASQAWECPQCPWATPSLSDNTFPSIKGTKHLEATGGGKIPEGKEGVGEGLPVFSILSAAPALLHGPHFLTPTLPSYRYPIPLLGSGPNLSCPLTPTRCCRAEGGAQCQGFIRANEGSALQMPVRDMGEDQDCPQHPHHNLGHSAPSSPSPAEEQKATPLAEERDLE